MAIKRELTFTVAADGCVTPSAPQDGGVQGEHNATMAVFQVEGSAWADPDYAVYIECEDNAGNVDATEQLKVTDGKVSYLLPLAWTQYGGLSTLRLVAEQLAVGGDVVRSDPATVSFSARQNASQKVDGLLKTRMVPMLQAVAAVEEAVHTAENAASGAVMAKNETVAARDRAVEAAIAAVPAASRAEDAAQRAEAAAGAGGGMTVIDDGEGNVYFTTNTAPAVCQHTYTVTVTTESTCGTDGERTYTCSKCGYTYTETIPATGNHVYDGAVDAVCNVCGHIRDVECDHEYSAVVTAPTCTTGGYTTHTCTKCGDTYVDDYTDALGHNYDDDSDAVCNVCGHEREVDVPDEPTQEVLAFDWEIGDLTAAGKELGPAAPYNTVLRTVDGYQLPYNAVTVTPADGYKVGYKEFNTADCAEGTVTNVKAASPDPYTFNPNPNCYYRFVIASTTSGTVANENWHTNVTIVGVTEVTPTTFALRRTVVADEIEDAGELQSLTVNKRKYSSFHDKGAHNRIDELKTQIERANGIIGSNWEWEQGDVKTNGSLADSTTLWRTVEYINLGEYDSVVVTPSNGYKCGYRAFIKSGDTYTIVSGGSNTATTEPFTITPDPTYYYRFVIASTTSGEIADDTWDNNVTFKVGTGGTTDNTATAEEILAPDYEVIALPSAVGEWQDIVKVGNELWLCDESTTVHGSLDGYIYRLNASDFSYIGAFKHNLGHLNSVDYDADNDRLITGSASNASTETPKIWIFENVLAWTELPDGAELTYVSLDATEIDLSADISANSSYINTCWGERNSTGNHSVYVNANLGAQWLKIYPTISGGQYTGAYTVGWEKTYTKQNIPNNTQAQVIQGMDLYNGRIIAALTHTPITCAMMHFNDSDKATRTIIQMDWGTTGAMEGLTVIDGYIYGGISQVRKLAKFKV